MDSEFVDSLEEEFEKREGRESRLRGRNTPRYNGSEGRKNPYSARERRRKVRRLHSL